MVSAAEAARRVVGRVTHRLESLPILALSVHSACNCRCVMCDIWKANSEKREISLAQLKAHVADLRALHVRRVMLTGGEPLLHRNLWALCDTLRDENIRVTLVTTGLLVAPHVDEIARHVDQLVISIDGPPDVHDSIRRVRGGYERIEHGLGLLQNYSSRPRTTARCVIQRANHATLAETINSIQSLGVDHVSVLGADVSSTAFNRAQPWPLERQYEIALSPGELPGLAAAIRDVQERCSQAVESGFVVGGLSSLWRIYDYYCANAGLRPFPPVRCNAPWVSAVLEPGGQVRPCFFHPPYAGDAHSLHDTLNAPAAVAFRRSLSVTENETCKRCVCTLSLPSWTEP